MCVAPAVRVAASMLPVAVGAATMADTVTVNCFRSSLPDFVPMTVTVAEPAPIGLMVTSVPDLEVWTMSCGDAAPRSR